MQIDPNRQGKLPHVNPPSPFQSRDGRFRGWKACFDLRTGTEFWKQPIEGEIITTPVLAEGHVHFATLDGTLHRVRQSDGHIEWKEPRNATSSPVVWQGECYFSQRHEVAGGGSAQQGPYQAEWLAARALHEPKLRQYEGTSRKADYLDHVKRMHGSPVYAGDGGWLMWGADAAHNGRLECS